MAIKDPAYHREWHRKMIQKETPEAKERRLELRRQWRKRQEKGYWKKYRDVGPVRNKRHYERTYGEYSECAMLVNDLYFEMRTNPIYLAVPTVRAENRRTRGRKPIKEGYLEAFVRRLEKYALEYNRQRERGQARPELGQRNSPGSERDAQHREAGGSVRVPQRAEVLREDLTGDKN